jgi:lysozyme family protein
MARETFQQALSLIFRHEGGYVDHPLDPGGATNMGITRATLASHRGRPVSKADVLALDRAEAARVYRARYWDPISADRLPRGLDLAVFDAAVNSGPGRAVRWLQRELSVREDGVVGPVTLAAARAQPIARLIRAYSRRRLGFLEALPTWTVFGRGWRRRVSETEAAALALAGQGAADRPSLRPKDETPMTDTKSLLASRTLWSNLIGLGAIVLSLAGIHTSAADTTGLAEAVPQVVAGLSFIASTIFRIGATKRIATM